MTDEDLLAQLAEAAAVGEELAKRLQRADELRDELIRDLMQRPVAREDIADAAGLGMTRLYQIRKGVRS